MLVLFKVNMTSSHVWISFFRPLFASLRIRIQFIIAHLTSVYDLRIELSWKFSFECLIIKRKYCWNFFIWFGHYFRLKLRFKFRTCLTFQSWWILIWFIYADPQLFLLTALTEPYFFVNEGRNITILLIIIWTL